MNFYSVLEQETDEFIADIIEFDDGVCVIKFCDYRFPTSYNSIEEVIEDIKMDYYLVKDGVKEVI